MQHGGNHGLNAVPALHVMNALDEAQRLEYRAFITSSGKRLVAIQLWLVVSSLPLYSRRY